MHHIITLHPPPYYEASHDISSVHLSNDREDTTIGSTIPSQQANRQNCAQGYLGEHPGESGLRLRLHCLV